MNLFAIVLVIIQSLINIVDSNPQWERFSSFRNFEDVTIKIDELPEVNEVTDTLIFDVMTVPEYRMLSLPMSFGDVVGPLLMPKFWELSSYYCCGKINVVNGVDSFIIYVSNYCRSNRPLLFLLNVKDNSLTAVLKLSYNDDGGHHYYSTNDKDAFIQYESSGFYEEETLINNPISPAHLPDNMPMYIEKSRFMVDVDGFICEE